MKKEEKDSMPAGVFAKTMQMHECLGDSCKARSVHMLCRDVNVAPTFGIVDPLKTYDMIVLIANKPKADKPCQLTLMTRDPTLNVGDIAKSMGGHGMPGMAWFSAESFPW